MRVCIALFAVACLQPASEPAPVDWSAGAPAAAAAPADLALCQPPRVEPGAVGRWTVTGAPPGARVWFVAGDAPRLDGEGCRPDRPCLDITGVSVADTVFADADGTASVALPIPADVGPVLAMQAAVLTAPLSASTLSNATYAWTDTCGLSDVCGDVPDTDGDGTPDACDRCPGANDAADADRDGVPDACDWAGADGFEPLFPDREELPPERIPDCTVGEEATIEGTLAVVMGRNLEDEGIIVAPAAGWYDVYDLYVAESGPSQRNESAYFRIANAQNPEGYPYLPNCGDERIVADDDNDGTPDGRVLIGTWWLEAGENTVTMHHYCWLWAEGACPEFHDAEDPGSTCDSGNPNSAHLDGLGLCVVPVE